MLSIYQVTILYAKYMCILFAYIYAHTYVFSISLYMKSFNIATTLWGKYAYHLHFMAQETGRRGWWVVVPPRVVPRKPGVSLWTSSCSSRNSVSQRNGELNNNTLLQIQDLHFGPFLETLTVFLNLEEGIGKWYLNIVIFLKLYVILM